MKRIQNTARNIFVMDDAAAYGSVEAANEQPQTAPIAPVPEKNIAHPLRGLLTSAISFIATDPDMSFSDDEADAMAQHDDLIPLYEANEEEGVEPDGFATAVSVLDSIADSLGGQHDGVHAPLFLSAFKSRFLR